MTLPTLQEYRDRGITLPADDTVAQDVIDGEEAWLARRIGLLEGERTETFHVGYAQAYGKLGLSRYTDEVEIEDGAATVAADRYRLVDRGSAIERVEPHDLWWTGPYVSATYTPTDADEVRRALFDLVGVAASAAASPFQSESIGAYSYSGGGAANRAGARGVIASSILPRRDPILCIRPVSRRVGIEDPVINRAEPL